ncbi:MAG: cell division protein FtsQ/DivIB [Pseudomonadota bacterium]|nr:cell division protein FtsQ/DivIB [Pseudomonadota bacterium]
MAELPDYLRPRRPKPTPVAVNWPARLSWAGSWLLMLLALALCAVGVWRLVQTIQSAPTAEVRVVGELSQPQRMALQSRLQPLVSAGYFTADLATIRDGALALPWVDQVKVTRQWPDGIVVRVLPRHPVARWGSGRLLSDQGVVFTEVTPVDRRDLPLLHGPASQSQVMMQQYQKINQWFAPLGIRLQELHLTERMTWFMKFDSDLRVIVDQEQTHTKLQRLSYLAQQGLHDAWPHVAAIDLRYRNGMALQWNSGRPPLIREGQFVRAELPSVSTAVDRLP